VLLAVATPAAIVTPAPGGGPWEPARLATLGADLDAVLKSAALRNAHVGVLAVDAATGATLYAHNANDDFQPASTLKLLVGSAALERLGPGFRFVTSAALAPASPGGGAASAAVLRAGGDPFLDAAALDQAVAALVAAGAAPQNGWLIDDSRYDRVPYPEGWTWDDFAQDYAAPVAAIAFEENVLHLSVAPGANVGDAARVSGGPLEHPVAMQLAGTCGWDPIVGPFATTGPPGSESTLDVTRTASGCTNVIGAVAQGAAPESIDAAVSSPVLYAQRYLNEALRRAGRTFSPRAGVGSPVDAARYLPASDGEPASNFWVHGSGPLRTWLGPRFWIPSDNLVAEVLLKELGFATGGKPGSSAKGLAFERAWLKSIGVDPATTTLADGSGLSQYDRITPRDLVAILSHDWNGPNRELVLGSLPVGGARGTIEGIAGTPAAGRVFAKTGSMSHVRGLAGYLAPLHHGAVIFSFAVDDWNGRYAELAAARAAVLSRLISD
jgi:D-alanyl-D-alanine carboxypeptidase/D-alanyl-D-alanine-endopeptidase (penicillin-binding protein 4)